MRYVSMYMNNLGKENWKELKWILRYLRGTTTHGLCFGGLNTILQEYVDSYMASDIDSRMNAKGYAFTVSGTTIRWILKLQSVVSLFTIETKYFIVTNWATN